MYMRRSQSLQAKRAYPLGGLARDKHGQTSRLADPVVLKLDLLRIRSFHYTTSYEPEHSYVLCL